MIPFNTAGIDGFSLHSAFLELYFNGKKAASGSGLLAKVSGSTILITALHNFTGRNEHGDTVSETACWPDSVRVRGYGYQCDFPLYHGDNDSNQLDAIPIFWSHPDNLKIDLAILPVNLARATPLDSSFLSPDNGRHVQLRVSQLCHIVGYPEGIFQTVGEGVLPIWKTGHIASEPSIYENGLPRIYIDAATTKGMSGSPVYVREQTSFISGNRLLGIYTGRTSELSDVGLVYTPHAIRTIIEKGPSNLPIPYPQKH